MIAAGETIVIEVAGKPLAKGRGRIGMIQGHAMIFTPKKTRNHENHIKMEAARAMKGRPPLSGPATMHVIAFVPIPQSFSKKKREMALAGELFPVTKPDLDNYQKSALDGCNQIVFVDDNQIVVIHAYKKYSERPRLRIEVRPL